MTVATLPELLTTATETKDVPPTPADPPAADPPADHVYNANHDVTETRVSLEGSTDPAERTITRSCYGSACNTGDAGDDLQRSPATSGGWLPTRARRPAIGVAI